MVNAYRLPAPNLFTGQRLDGTGLYYYNARYYDPQIGRFISTDTIIPNPANPQSFNRYSYCLNNPLKYVDPSGHDAYLAMLQHYGDRPKASHYGDIDSFAGDMITWENELGEIKRAYGAESPAPSLPEFPYTSSDSKQPSLPIESKNESSSQPASTANHAGEGENDKHGLPTWEKVILTIEATAAIGLFIGVAGAATVVAPPAGIILVPAAIGAGWAWWMIVSSVWRPEE